MDGKRASSALPDGFVYLEDVDRSIQQSLRYATNENFVGRLISGYGSSSSRVVCTRECAEALKNVQDEVSKDGYSLVVYDAYRPQRAVDDFYRWSSMKSDILRKKEYYPDIDKSNVFELGYIAARSGHTRGSTVDLTLINHDVTVSSSPTYSVRNFPNYPDKAIPYLDDNTIDMGSSFDLMDEASHHNSRFIPEELLSRRNYLREKMLKHGFLDLDEEWWHYGLKNEPFPDTYFDFEIV